MTALQKQVDDASQLSVVSAALKENNSTGTVSNTKVDEKSISIARKVMKILGREKKIDSA